MTQFKHKQCFVVCVCHNSSVTSCHFDKMAEMAKIGVCLFLGLHSNCQDATRTVMSVEALFLLSSASHSMAKFHTLPSWVSCVWLVSHPTHCGWGQTEITNFFQGAVTWGALQLPMGLGDAWVESAATHLSAICGVQITPKPSVVSCELVFQWVLGTRWDNCCQRQPHQFVSAPRMSSPPHNCFFERRVCGIVCPPISLHLQPGSQINVGSKGATQEVAEESQGSFKKSSAKHSSHSQHCRLLHFLAVGGGSTGDKPVFQCHKPFGKHKIWGHAAPAGLLLCVLVLPPGCALNNKSRRLTLFPS